MIGVAGVLGTPAFAKPYVPTNDAQLIGDVPAAAHHEQQDARRLASARLDVAAPLAQIYINEARASGDLRFLGYAEAVLAPWVAREPGVPEALVLQATLQQSRHEFAASLRTLERALAVRPDDPQAWLTRATVLRVQGRYEEASGACRQVAQRSDASVAAICLQGVRSLQGELPAAYTSLAQLPAQEMPEAVRAWRASELGEMAVRAGRDADAERWFRSALALNSHDFYVRAALADLLLRSQRAAEALSLLQGQESIEPLLLRMALAQKQLHEPGLARSRERLAAAFDAEQQRGEAVHRREQARFLLDIEDRPREALAVALANWQVQREPDDALVLAEAARAAGHPEAASTAFGGANAALFQDARLTLARGARS